MNIKVIDIGVNLDHRSFDTDREAVIHRAVDAGVTTMVLTGTTEKVSQGAYELASKHSGVLYSTAGIHPHNAKQCKDKTLSFLKNLASKLEVVAIGECGLDFNRDFSPRPVQEKWFEKQVQLACELQMPLFLHEREAHERLIAILKEYEGKYPAAVVHCFTGNQEELETYLDMGLHIGITGWICDERRGFHLREIVPSIPLNRLMVETDSPFLTPRDLRPKPKKGRNEPAFLPHVLRSIAECLGKSPKEIAQATTQTARKFFQLPAN